MTLARFFSFFFFLCGTIFFFNNAFSESVPNPLQQGQQILLDHISSPESLLQTIEDLEFFPKTLDQKSVIPASYRESFQTFSAEQTAEFHSILQNIREKIEAQRSRFSLEKAEKIIKENFEKAETHWNIFQKIAQNIREGWQTILHGISRIQEAISRLSSADDSTKQ